MLMIGYNIKQPDDKLSKIDVDQIYSIITKPHSEVQQLTNQLKTILTIDPKQYQILQSKLPYITCGLFFPNYRETENFASIQHLIINIDNISNKELNINLLIETFKQNPNTHLLFTSPDNNEIKIIFSLKEKIFDQSKYSIFYKIFSYQISSQYNLKQLFNKSTYDVKYTCFINYDPNAYYNRNPELIDITQYVDFENHLEINKTLKEIDKIYENINIQNQNNETVISEKNKIDKNILIEISKKLNPNYKPKKNKSIYVPPELYNIENIIKPAIAEYNISIKQISNINYGKKVSFQYQNIWAELNIFYGKKGYTIVKSLKNGSDPELLDAVYNIICQLFYNTK